MLGRMPPELERYTKVRSVASNLDPFEDVLGFVQAMHSADYTTDVLRNVHGLSDRLAKSRARQVVSHVRAVLAFVRQARESDRAYAFLPAYYAILNMLRIPAKVATRSGLKVATLRSVATPGG